VTLSAGVADRRDIEEDGNAPSVATFGPDCAEHECGS
jgi:hypothetical protein